ncbi:hypothetical protein [Streptomyces sp. NPDC006285]|uniref:hypothetical protein n=1 Tax=Streptomyces sp. NPDC006285 TaxID=3364742 RepID=UPI0036A74C16
MAPHFANGIPAHLSMWQRVRAYAVPPSMIEKATARRAVGDWAGACAAARVYVDLDLRAVRLRHGTEVATRLRADLRRLAPDLLRWHMPRIAPDGRLRPGLTLSLARYGTGQGSSAGPPLHLVVRTPPAWADAGQHLSLALWEGPRDAVRGHHPHPHPDRRFRLDLHRHLWDADRSGELASRCGARGAPALTPSDQSSVIPQPVPPGEAGRPAEPALPDGVARLADHNTPFAVGNWAVEAELLLRAEGLSRGAFTVRLGARRRAVLELVAPDDRHVPALRPLGEDVLPAQEIAALPVLPETATRVLADLELLRTGLVPPERLHPLVAAALRAALEVAGPAPVPGPVSASSDPHRVECRGESHRIALRDGVLTAVDHDPAQLRREELLVALGGPALPCLRAIDAVHRDPEALPAVRERLRHGDVTGALAVVEGLLGPAAVLRDGPLRDELESATARRVDHGLFRSGLSTVRSGIGAGAVEGENTSDVGRAKASRRPRIDRLTPVPVRRKLSSRSRPRTGLAC